MSRKGWRVPVVLCVLAGVAGGCGRDRNPSQAIREKGGVAGTAGHESGTVCAMVPKEEIGQVIGAAITEVNDVRTACEYHTADPAVFVTIRVDQGRHAAAAMEGSKMAANMFGGGDNADKPPKPPPQFGDNAVYGTNGSLALLKDGVYVSVMPPIAEVRSEQVPAPQFLPDERKRSIANTLAAKVLQRLKR